MVYWRCSCNNCSPMETAKECICCQELPEIQAKCQQVPNFGLGEKPKCICEHPGFHPVCLNIWNLQAVHNEYRQKYWEPRRPNTRVSTYLKSLSSWSSPSMSFIQTLITQSRGARHLQYDGFHDTNQLSREETLDFGNLLIGRWIPLHTLENKTKKFMTNLRD